MYHCLLQLGEPGLTAPKDTGRMKQCWAVESQKRQELGFATAFGLKAHFQIRLTMRGLKIWDSESELARGP